MKSVQSALIEYYTILYVFLNITFKIQSNFPFLLNELLQYNFLFKNIKNIA